jgi:glycosyltransferase involved in cell wall biosynthesis
LYRERTENIIKKLSRVKYIKCASFREIKRILRQCDVIYTKNELLELSILKILGHGSLPPIIVGMHTPVYISNPIKSRDRLHNFLYGGFLYKFLLRGTAAVHVLNSDDLKLLRDKFKYPLVYKILLPFHSQKHILIQSGNQPGDFHILFVGQLTPQKGINILLECIERLEKRGGSPPLRFRVAGSGDAEFILQFQGLSKKYPNIEYFGYVPNGEISALYEWADIVLVPSQYETANYVTLEAGSNGKIVVASDVSGPRETIKNNETGFLVSANADAFVEKIEYLYNLKANDPNAFREIGAQAVLYINEKFNPEMIYGQFRDMLATCSPGNNNL